MYVAAVDWTGGIEDAWSGLVTFLPKLAGFVVILLAGYVVARAIARIFSTVLDRVGFDRWVERGGLRRALAQSRYDASDLMAKVVFYGLFLLVLQLAFGIFGANPVSDLIAGVVAYVPKVVAAIVIVVIAAAVAAAARELIHSALGGLSYGSALGSVAAIGITTVGVFAALNQLEIAPAIVNGLFYAALAVVAGSAIIAIGGGGIQPMRARWEAALRRWDEERPRVQAEVQTSRPRPDDRAEAREAGGEAGADAAAR